MARYQGGNRLIVGSLFLVLTFWMFAQSILMTLMPVIARDFGITDDPANMDLLNIAAAITPLITAVCLVAAGGLADRYGRMKVTVIGGLLSIAGSVIVALSGRVEMLIVGRCLQGISAACIMPSTLALIRTYYTGEKQATALTCWSVGSWVGSGFCTFVTGLIEPVFGWQSVFWLSVVIAIIGLVLLSDVPEVRASSVNGRFNRLGSAVFVVALICLVLALSKGRSWGYGDIKFVGLLLISVMGLVAFYVVEKNAGVRENLQLIDFSHFKCRAYIGATLSNFLINMTAGTVIVINYYLQQGRGLGTAEIAALSVSYAVMVLLFLPVGQKILLLFGSRLPMIAGAAFTCIGIMFMSLTGIMQLATYKLMVTVGYALFGMGSGIYATPSLSTAVSCAPHEKAAVAAGIYKLASTSGVAIGVALSLFIFSAVNDINKAGAAGLGFNVLMGGLALLVVVFIVPKKWSGVTADAV